MVYRSRDFNSDRDIRALPISGGDETTPYDSRADGSVSILPQMFLGTRICMA
jgi:hypothetical protein